MSYLPNGDLAMVIGEEEMLTIVEPDGASQPPYGWMHEPYGTAVDMQGRLYVADNAQIYRIDTESGDYEALLDGQLGANIAPRSIGFNRDYTILYVGPRATSTTIYQLPIDEQGNAGELSEWAELDVGGWDPAAWTDGIGVDECGNVYIPEYFSQGLWRIPEEGGQGERIVNWWDYGGEEAYGHAIAWGSGIDGWNEYSVYLPQPYGGNAVVEVELGVRSKQMPAP
jgi:hypothetical protein